MKRYFLAINCIVLINILHAQQTLGRVVYQRTLQMQIQVDDNDGIAPMLPRMRVDKFELNFGNHRSIWKRIVEEDDADVTEGNGMQIRMVGPGQNDIVFYDFGEGKKVEQREMFDKNFIVEDSIRKLNWKLTGEMQTILGHVCQKAVAQNTVKRLQMTLDNGKMERKEVQDTTAFIAWFTTDVPVPAGPEIAGQLPGLVLFLDMNNGRMVYQAIEMSATTDLAAIKAPVKGKRVTPDQFTQERNKMMDEMQRNNQGNGGNRIIIRD